VLRVLSHLYAGPTDLLPIERTGIAISWGGYPTLPGDYTPQNLRWALQALGRLSTESSFAA